MNHQDLEAELPFYVNRTLEPEVAAQVERSLADCPTCAEDVAELRALRDALRDDEARAAEPPASLHDDVFARLGETGVPVQRPIGLPRIPRIRIAQRVWMGAGLALAAVFALLFVMPKLRGANDVDSQISNFSAPNPHFGEDVPVVEPPAAKSLQAAGAGGVAATTVNGAAASDSTEAHRPASGSDDRDRAAAHGRQLARSATVGLLVGDVATSLAKIQRLADAQFGAITALQDHAPAYAGGTHTAEVTLSIPDDRFERTLDTVAALGGITNREVATEDLTDSIVDSEARLRNLRHEEADLVRIMDRSGRVSDILDVEQQLASTRQSIEELDAQNKAMQRRVSYATIAIDLTDEKQVPIAMPGPLAQIGDQWSAALTSLWHFTLAVIALALWLIAFAPYFIVLGFAIWFVRRRMTRAARTES